MLGGLGETSITFELYLDTVEHGFIVITYLGVNKASCSHLITGHPCSGKVS